MVGEKAHELLGALKKLGLHIEEMTAKEHDKAMAYAHALTFTVGRVLNRLKLDDLEIVTPSFQKLLDVAELDSKHSDELFDTITKGNAYFGDVLAEFRRNLEEVVSDADHN